MRAHRPAVYSGYTILIVDDDEDYSQASQKLLEREGHTVLTANNGPKALQILKAQHIDLLFLDYFMPEMNGEIVVRKLRKFNQDVQIILQTGYATEKPPREMLKRLDIQGYYDKSDGPEKLLLWADVGLKSVYTIQLLAKSRQCLQYLLNVPTELRKIKPLTDLLQGILWQIIGILGVVDSFLAVHKNGNQLRKKMEHSDSQAEHDRQPLLRIYASSGRFDNHTVANNALDDSEVSCIQDVLLEGSIAFIDGATIIPLKIIDNPIGVIYLDQEIDQSQDVDLLLAFADRAAIAIQNTNVYEEILRNVRAGYRVGNSAGSSKDTDL